MPRRPAPVSGPPRWGVAVILVGTGAFAALLPIAMNRADPGPATPVEIRAAAPPTSAAPRPPAEGPAALTNSAEPTAVPAEPTTVSAAAFSVLEQSVRP